MRFCATYTPPSLVRCSIQFRSPSVGMSVLLPILKQGKLGFTADEMFSIFQEGADSGAWNLDKVGDAVKEFSIRSIDGSKTTAHAFESLGLDAEEMMGIFAAGGEDASIAFQGVLAALMDMDDEVQRDMIGVELFGTQWEDLGTEAISSLRGMQSGAYDAENALAKINDVKYDNLDSAMEGIKRQAEVALLPAAGEVQQAFMNIAPKIEGLLIKAEPVFTQIAGYIGPTITAAIDFAENGIGFVCEHINVLLPLASALTGALLAYKGVTAAVAAYEAIKTAALASDATVTGVASVATWGLNAAMSALSWPIIAIVAGVALVIGAFVALCQNWDTVKMYAGQLGEFLATTWENIKTGVSGFIGGIVDGFKAGFSSLVGIVKGPINSVIGIVNGAIDGINAIGFDIPDWVPVIGGQKFALNIPKLPMLAAGGDTDGISIAGEAGLETVISYDPAYRAENLSYWAEAGRRLGADESGYSLGESSSTTCFDFSGMTFAPVIKVDGVQNEQEIIHKLEDAEEEFVDFLIAAISKRTNAYYGEPCGVWA